ncbi:MAG: ferrous iron transport protein A [Bacteroidota bacterium]|nr:ferrous iron transport protein A [Bacteroidota bacterium]MDX5430103.1 ferrous iron transport protein A [Bacteroidota bacterium]MDX5468867.1 ferrous iron transport protein A [Bacteroidota bacterium]
MNLADLHKGKTAVISAIDEQLLAERLQEFGIFSGSLIRLLGAAPSGCPIMLEAGGTQLGLRKEQALQIKISPLD